MFNRMTCKCSWKWQQRNTARTHIVHIWTAENENATQYAHFRSLLNSYRWIWSKTLLNQNSTLAGSLRNHSSIVFFTNRAKAKQKFSISEGENTLQGRTRQPHHVLALSFMYAIVLPLKILCSVFPLRKLHRGCVCLWRKYFHRVSILSRSYIIYYIYLYYGKSPAMAQGKLKQQQEHNSSW